MKLVLISLCLPALVHAGPKVEVGGILGAHSFSHNTELGSTDDSMQPGPASSGLFGARAAYVITPRVAIEGELAVIPTKDDVLDKPAMVYGLGAHVRFDLLTGKLRPFVVAGIGANILRSSSPQMTNDVDQAYHWGLGARWALSERVDLRVDGRQEIVPDRHHNGATSDFEVTLGATYRLGSIKRPKPMVVAAPPEEPPPPTPAPAPPPPVVAPELIRELAGIGFELDSAVVSIDSAPIMERAYELLHSHPQLGVEISGHTSADGDAERNLKLSLERAEAVKAYLVGRGIAAERIQTVGHGSDVPIAANQTDAGRRQNRRIEFHVLER
ncbi:N/A [soil metagenome]